MASGEQASDGDGGGGDDGGIVLGEASGAPAGNNVCGRAALRWMGRWQTSDLDAACSDSRRSPSSAAVLPIFDVIARSSALDVVAQSRLLFTPFNLSLFAARLPL